MKATITKYVTCNKCKWVHIEVTRKSAQKEVKKFNKYFDSLTKDKQEEYYRSIKSSIELYEGCFRCGNSYKDFNDTLDKEISVGSTIQPIISRKD